MKYGLIITIILIGKMIQAQIKQSPVSITATQVIHTDAGKSFDVSVHFHVQPPWYIYAPTGVNQEQGMIESKIAFTPPPGFTRAGKVKLPETHYKNGYEILKGDDVVMSQLFKASPSIQPGEYKIKGKVTWQSCSDAVCMPPIIEDIVINVMLN